MSSIEKTAYPRFLKRKKIKPDELHRSYSLQPDEMNMINLAANKNKLRLNLAIQLKTFQRLGYFIDMEDIPSEIMVHIRQELKYHHRLSHGYINEYVAVDSLCFKLWRINGVSLASLRGLAALNTRDHLATWHRS
jgi:hypothetical protein